MSSIPAIQKRIKPIFSSRESLRINNNNNNLSPNQTESPLLSSSTAATNDQTLLLSPRSKMTEASFLKRSLSKLKDSSTLNRLLKRKLLGDLIDQSKVSHFERTLTWFDLTMLGIGGIIGTGIFVLQVL